ncbi:hypothetical protein, partial [Anoxybacillus kestanbolensis]|uniref:hypothetical protein n=1 Tax=Anoxybacillus kestanbolensis TaxID=227476 RepID=UPI003D1BF1A5
INISRGSIPVRSFSGDLIKKSPLGMMQGCQPHHSPYQGGLQMNCTQNYKNGEQCLALFAIFKK